MYGVDQLNLYRAAVSACAFARIAATAAEMRGLIATVVSPRATISESSKFTPRPPPPRLIV